MKYLDLMGRCYVCLKDFLICLIYKSEIFESILAVMTYHLSSMHSDFSDRTYKHQDKSPD